MEKAQPQIAAWLMAKKLSYKAFAGDLGVSPEMVSRIMCGRRVPGPVLRNLIAASTGLDVADKEKWT